MRHSMALAAAGAISAGCGGEESPAGEGAGFDLGVTASYEASFDEGFDFEALYDLGVRRVSLYYPWKELDLGLVDPDDPAGVSLDDQVDPTVAHLESAGLRASLVIEITDTDCGEGADLACWVSWGVPEELRTPEFPGFGDETLGDRLADLAEVLVTRYSPDVVTHVFLGNETDQTLRAFPDEVEGFAALMARLRARLEPIEARSRWGTIFTFVPDALEPGHGDLMRGLAPDLEVVGLTVYPYLFTAFGDEGPPFEPAEDSVALWFDAAVGVAEGRPLVVSETGHPSGAGLGTPESQADFVRHLVSWLEAEPRPVEWIGWWSLDDSETHPDEVFRTNGLLDDGGEPRPAWELWAAATAGD